MKRLLFSMLGLGLAAFAGWIVYAAMVSQPGTQETQMRTIESTVGRRDFSSRVLATGTVKPKVGARISVGARASGKVEKLFVGVGDEVRKGDVLAEIEHEDLEAEVNQRLAQIESVNTQIRAERSRTEAEMRRLETLLEQKQAELVIERKRLDSIRELHRLGIASEELQLASLEAQLKREYSVAKAQEDESKASLSYARKDARRMETLFQKGMLPEQTRDKADTDLDTARSRFESARGQSALVKTRLDQEVALQKERVTIARTTEEHEVALQVESVAKAELAVRTATEELASARVSSQATIDVLESGLPQLQAQLEQARTKRSYASIVAPISGVVGEVSTQEGETVAAGFASPTFVSVVDLSRLQVDAYVDEVDIGKMKPGLSATFVVDAFPDVVFEGRVVTIYPSAIVQDNVVYYDVVIEITSDFVGRLRPEMTANVTIEVASRKDVLAIPSMALIRGDGTASVRVRSTDGIVDRSVEVGLDDGELVEISSGLEEGEVVIHEEVVMPEQSRAGGPP